MFARSALCVLLLAFGIATVHAQTSIVDTVVGSADHTTLETLVINADLVTALSSQDRSFTLFAPTDAAFTALGDNTLVSKLTSTEDRWKPLLQEVLKYHVLEDDAAVLAAGLPATATDFNTLASAMDDTAVLTLDNVAPQIEGKAPGVGSATVGTADLQTDNGVVHTVDAVLLPPATQRDVVQIAVDGGFSTLADLLTAAELVTTLQTDAVETAFTVFAPTNDAFAAVDADLLTCLQEADNKPLLQELLKLHVVDGTVMSADLTDGQTITSIAGTTSFNDNTYTYTAAGSTLTASGTSAITTADILGTNGVVHVIGAVIVPEGFACPAPATTIVDIVEGSADHTTLETLLTNAQLVSTLESREREFTLFAPTDTAIQAVDSVMLGKLGGADSQWYPLLAKVLAFHVLADDASVMAADLPATANDFATLAADAMLTIKADAPQIAAKAPGAGTATVATADLKALNGVVHVIDAVLLPPEATRTVVDIATGSADHTTLVSLLTAANLVDTLSAAGADDAFTVFAPTNAAFTALGQETLTCLQAAENADLLAEVLKYHVAAGVTVEAGLTDSTPTLATSFTSNAIPVADISATATDLLASNGVVHVVDAVLVPADFACSVTPATTPEPSVITTPAPSDSAAGAVSASQTLVMALAGLAAALALW